MFGSGFMVLAGIIIYLTSELTGKSIHDMDPSNTCK